MFPLPLLWLIACFVLQLALAVRGADTFSNATVWAWIGSMWAGWAGCVWLSSSLRNAWFRIVLIVVVGVWHVWWMAVVRDTTVVRYVIMMCGYAMTQSILFRLLRVPDWSFDELRLVLVSRGKRQFSILELLALMTFTAFLVTAAKRYEPPSGHAFWYGSPVVFVSLAVTATLCALAIVSHKRSDRRLFAAGTVAAVMFGSGAMAGLEAKFNPDFILIEFRAAIKVLWQAYFYICASFAMSLILLAATGRTQFTAARKSDLPNSDDDESPPSGDLLPFRQPPRT